MADSTNEALVAREKDDEDSGLSMLDVLEEEEALEDVANAVLGDSDDKNCTYDMVNYSTNTVPCVKPARPGQIPDPTRPRPSAATYFFGPGVADF